MCGIIAIIGKQPIAESIYQSMIQLQHRGQDAAGMFTFDPQSGKHYLRKNKGLVSQVFTTDTIPLSKAPWGMGHVRYNTVGSGNIEDTQPLVYKNDNQLLAAAYNGNVVNYVPLKEQMIQEGYQFETNCDAEVILHLLAKHLPEKNCQFEDICSAVSHVYNRVSGAYSVVAIIANIGMIAFRDPSGIRPLLFGTQAHQKTYAFASETYALTFLNYSNHSSVHPGEVFFVDSDFQVHRRTLKNKRPSYCSFEFNYFAKPNTVIEGREVYRIRSDLGKALARKMEKLGYSVDVVVPIPNTARPAAISMARELGVLFEDGFVKQDHIGRTFIMPTQVIRDKAISRKLAPVLSVFEGKDVILVDDSIVRGTVSKKVVYLAKRAGARKVLFASTFPPISYPCIYGIDFASQEQLLAWERTPDEVCKEIGADGLVYNDVDELKQAIGIDGVCTACIDGKYPTNIEGMEELSKMRNRDIEKMESALT